MPFYLTDLLDFFLHNKKTAADVVVVTFCQEGGMDAKKKAKKARQCIRIIIDE